MCFNFVGGATHSKEYKGPTIPDAANLLTKQLKGHFGGVTIAERHEKKGNEHETLLKKQSLGAEWFITQAIYDQEPTIKLINDYSKLCKERNVKPVKIILTFAPCGREKTMTFIIFEIKRLGSGPIPSQQVSSTHSLIYSQLLEAFSQISQ